MSGVLGQPDVTALCQRECLPTCCLTTDTLILYNRFMGNVKTVSYHILRKLLSAGTARANGHVAL